MLHQIADNHSETVKTTTSMATINIMEQKVSENNANKKSVNKTMNIVNKFHQFKQQSEQFATSLGQSQSEKAAEKGNIVPKIVHYTWYDSKRTRFRFHHLTSILAAHKFIKPNKIIFWYEKLPEGYWWREA